MIKNLFKSCAYYKNKLFLFMVVESLRPIDVKIFTKNKARGYIFKPITNILNNKDEGAQTDSKK